MNFLFLMIWMICTPASISTPVFDAQVANINSINEYLITDEPNYVSTYTQNGILAHNNQNPGNQFDLLEIGDYIYVNCENRDVLVFEVYGKRRFEALEVGYMNVETGMIFSTSQLFRSNYNLRKVLTLQTCIEKNGNYEWGRLFINAKLIDRQKAPRKFRWIKAHQNSNP